MLAVKIARASRMVGVRMIPADDLKASRARRFLSREVILSRHKEPVARGILAAVDDRLEFFDALAAIALRPAKQRPAAFMRIALSPVNPNRFCQSVAQMKHDHVALTLPFRHSVIPSF